MTDIPRTETLSSEPRLYRELAAWWPLLSAPADYAEEAFFYRKTLQQACDPPPRTVLELGSGGGNNASHLKRHFEMTLVDISPGMLEVSRELNPECQHIVGDMRRARLGRTFDAVFIHDAVMYMTSEEDLGLVMETAFVHLRPGGAALFVPDFVRENFQPGTDHGGHDGEEADLRYLDWIWDPDPEDTCYTVDYVYLIRESDGAIRVEQDRHILGLFPQATWLRLLSAVGFRARSAPFPYGAGEAGSSVLFLGVRERG